MAGCGGSTTAPSVSGQTGPSGQGPTGATITITSAGVTPKTLIVSAGAQVTFINDDGRSHQMSSNPHPEHIDCPEINQVGFLAPGQRRQTGNLTVLRTCGYHDHHDPLNISLQGSLVVR